MTQPRLNLHYGDLSDTSCLVRILQETQPDEVYNLGAQSHVAVSFESPAYTTDVDATGALRLLEAIRFLGLEKNAQRSLTASDSYSRTQRSHHYREAMQIFRQHCSCVPLKWWLALPSAVQYKTIAG